MTPTLDRIRSSSRRWVPPRERLRTALLRWAPGARRRRPHALDDSEGFGPPLAAAKSGLRLLLIRPDHLGDVVLAGPTVARLRAALPDAHLTLLVGPWSEGVAALLPAVDHLLVTPFPAFARGHRPSLAARYGPLFATARLLHRARYDAALILRDDDWWSAWLTALARIPRRIGHDHPALRPFLTHVLPASHAPRHVTAASLALADAALGTHRPPADPARDPLALRMSDAQHRAARALLDPTHPSDVLGMRLPLAIHPGSGSPIKRWHIGDWGEVARTLTDSDEPVVLTGGPDERDLTAAVARQLGRPAIDLAGLTDVGTLAAVFALCRLVLGPDSGPLHLAAAVGTPTVHLYGPADVRRFGPWGPPERNTAVASSLPCAPCGRLDWPAPEDHPCIRLLSPDDVVAAARRVGG